MCGRTKWCFVWYSDPELAELQHPSQRFYSNNYAIWFVLFRALFFSFYTFKAPGSTWREKSSFIVIQYLPDTAASCSSVRGDLASSVPGPTGRILCNVHFGLSLQLLAMLGILFLVIAYVQGHCFWCVGYLPADMEACHALYNHTAHIVTPEVPGGTACRKVLHLFISRKIQESTLQSLALVFLYWQFHVLNLLLLHKVNLWILEIPFVRVHWICMSPEKAFQV